MSTFERLRAAIADYPGIEVDPQKITVDANLRDDLGLDSLDEVAIELMLEEHFAIHVPVGASDDWRIIGDIVAFVDAESSPTGTKGAASPPGMFAISREQPRNRATSNNESQNDSHEARDPNIGVGLVADDGEVDVLHSEGLSFDFAHCSQPLRRSADAPVSSASASEGQDWAAIAPDLDVGGSATSAKGSTDA